MKKIFVLFCLSWSISIYAGYEEGVTAFNKGDYTTALKEWKLLAKQGNADAQNNLAVLYSQGLGINKDLEKSLFWCHKAAEQGHAVAQANLGKAYYFGNGVTQDIKKAVSWYRQAAIQGNIVAQSMLGILHKIGKGVVQDYSEAYAWLNNAAAQGDDISATSRDQLMKKMTPAQIEKGQTLSQKYFEKYGQLDYVN